MRLFYVLIEIGLQYMFETNRTLETLGMLMYQGFVPRMKSDYFST